MVDRCLKCASRANRRCVECDVGLHLWSSRFATQCINSIDNCNKFDSNASRCTTCDKGYLLHEDLYCVQDLNRYLWHYVTAFAATALATISVLIWIMVKFKGQFVKIKRHKKSNEDKADIKHFEESGRNIGKL